MVANAPNAIRPQETRGEGLARELHTALWNDQAAWADRQESLKQLLELHESAARALELAGSPEDLRVVISTAFRLISLPSGMELAPTQELLLLDRARRAAGPLEQPEVEANALWRQGLIHQRTGDLARAQATLEQAAAMAPRAPALAPWVLLDLGVVARQNGRWDNALHWLEQARSALDTDSYPAHVLTRASILGETFEIYMAFGTADQAALWLERERAAVAASPTLTTELALCLHEVDLALAQGDDAGAAAAVDQALERADMMAVSRDGAAKLHLRRALASVQLAETEEDSERAAAALESALGHLRLPPAERVRALLHLAFGEIARGQYDRAQSYLDLTGSNPNEAGQEGSRAAVSEHGPRGYLRALTSAVESRLALSRDPDPAQLRGHLATLQRSTGELLAEWGTTPVLPGGIGFLHFGGRRLILSQLIALTMAVHGPETGSAQAFNALMRAQALGTLARRLDIGACDLTEVQAELLESGEGLLVYFPAPDATHLFAIDRDSITYFELDGSEFLSPAQSALIRVVSSPPQHDARGNVTRADRERADEAARELSQMLLPADVSSWLDKHQEVTVSGADARAWIPFECLSGAGIGVLGLRRPLVHLPSVPIGLALARRSSSSQTESDLLLFADPEIGPAASKGWPQLRSLQLTDNDLQQLVSRFPSDRVQMRRGGEASLDQLLRDTQSGARVLQIVAHGVYDWKRELPTGLVLAPSEDGAELLWSEAAESLNAPELVVLLACGTARAPMRRGDEGLNHLAGAFLNAGARTVLSSHADLNLRASLQLLEKFNEALQAGKSSAEAMRRARAHLARKPEFAHPYYHSQLQLLGSGHRSLF